MSWLLLSVPSLSPSICIYGANTTFRSTPLRLCLFYWCHGSAIIFISPPPPGMYLVWCYRIDLREMSLDLHGVRNVFSPSLGLNFRQYSSHRYMSSLSGYLWQRNEQHPRHYLYPGYWYRLSKWLPDRTTSWSRNSGDGIIKSEYNWELSIIDACMWG